MSEKPIIGITMGDPASIGPEIAVKALLSKKVYDACRPLLIGNANVFQHIINALDIQVSIHSIQHIEDAKFIYGQLDVYDLGPVDLNAIHFGQVSAAAGDAAFRSVKKVIELAMDGQIDATVTGPINKKSISEAGHQYPGHTEIYAHYTNTKKYAMLLVEEQMRVIHVSTHVSLRQACDLVKKDRILEVIELLQNGLISLGLRNLKIGVAGLNPHAGDSGLFGTEDDEEIAPAVAEAGQLGYDVEGPVPADTLFSKAATGYYGGIVAMYHDQGHIPFKLTGFKWNPEKKQMDSVKGVNITMGLPIIRTSVDHGTAFEIAGKGIASEDAMLLAIEAATQLALNKVSST
ncbi:MULTISPECIES: 4-hydroxythreonine-4-phosphate dehydrogenase PdxA [Olivibacter]|jgi:4-hydroxythreonine-4-phosphate dehydrogenase|uniref:4-hydroxythreonine-4-phosphate dehydrogenase PdxA n=1 Tax=Olivibacter oleidegradans TaxID=760123 RepID=A0ABV6HEG3_9SPHI|nr:MULTISPECIES: 4-hydroxythreonine-4-phosphate dehydrogenase PdxA [Olivibacter]MCL4637516.1 4-hydroxythreonine-4-phosphate dehydrogenase PdxA [Olivibacter sp. UJ_SKK_5.1]MDM8177917.1 4-hydroxythreonine-4-phosphate dehydrogenase PdxA [Olivibacter sp. 47]QEK99602.1 4-hydroxythreonine-4-phosphate dehydrogenase PdxA [Olivibacter sp. LS-1]